MAILTDLPNELLLFVIAEVSPLDIDSFALSCKRIYGLRTDALREHEVVRSSLPTGPLEIESIDLLRTIFQKPGLALYPTAWEFYTGDRGYYENPYDLLAEINTQIQRGCYTATLETNRCVVNAADLIIPLLITRLLNLRKISISAKQQPHLIETVLQIVEASYDPILRLREPLPLGRLREVEIYALGDSVFGMELAGLLGMIPTLRKLQISHVSESKPYTCSHQSHGSEVTDLALRGATDSSFLVVLISRTHGLRNFLYEHAVHDHSAKLEPRRLVDLLKQRAGQSLTYLHLLTRDTRCGGGHCWDVCRNHNDLSLGSLREFATLKTLVTCVDMFIKTRGHGEYNNGTGTIQRLVSWLPASLETLVLHQGLEEWNKDVMRMLFRGFRNNKQARIPKLRLINFMKCPDFEHLMLDSTKSACQETGVKIGYTSHRCLNKNCPLVLKQLKKWEERPWIGALETCCQCERLPSGRTRWKQCQTNLD